MPETTTSLPKVEKNAPTFYGRHLHAYGFTALLLTLGLVLAVVLAFFGVEGPRVIPIDVAMWMFAVSLFVVWLALAYTLLTLRGMLRLVRRQATEMAVQRALLHKHVVDTPLPVTVNTPPATVIAQPARAPPVEYVTRGSDAHVLARRSRSVEVIEGIGPVYTERLQNGGLGTLHDLRTHTADEIATAANAPLASAQQWKSMAELLLVKPIDPQAAEILLRTGVTSIDELASQRPASLQRRAVRVNSSHDVRIYPERISRSQVRAWVEAAQRFIDYGRPAPVYGNH